MSAHPGQVAVVDVKTGETLHRWPIDAHELVASGACVTEAQWAAQAPVAADAEVETVEKQRKR